MSTIGPRAFEDCHSLQSLTLPLALKSLQAEVLRGCSHLEELTFGSEAGRSLPGRKHALFGVQKIYEEALRHCRMLSQLVLPPTVCWIDSHAFRGCKLLRTLGCRAKRPPMVMPNSFVGIDQASIELQVPSSSVDLYKRAPLWRDFGRICGIDESDVVA